MRISASSRLALVGRGHALRRRCTIRSTSSLERLVDAVIVICCSLPVPRSLALDIDDTVCIGVEDHFDLRHVARRRRNAIGRSIGRAACSATRLRALPGIRLHRPRFGRDKPSMSSLLRAGIAVFRGIRTVRTSPNVWMPSDSGVTSTRTTSFDVSTQHAGLYGRADRNDFIGIDLLDSLPPPSSLTRALTERHAGRSADQYELHRSGWQERRASLLRSLGLNGSRRCAPEDRGSSLRYQTRVNLMSRCLGPFWSAVMNGRLIVGFQARLDSSIFAFSDA